MDISLEDAISRLSTWSKENASLEVHFARPGLWLDAWVSIVGIRGTIVEMASEPIKLTLDFGAATFEWRGDAPSTSNFDVALQARFDNGDLCLISRLRAARSG